MKKFLSLALALVMSLSLLTVGAGATEYKDLNDKNEIQYEEAVAVLNKLGIITGYEDGSFKPTGALTRGAAAKIIVSLMIGSEAASNLTVAAAPYKDVPVTNTFASVISYCKTAGYISGYTDGTFRPTAPLTGYAFTKMLLGALGYDGKVEGFTGSGWTMNAARLGNKAGLFNDFNTAFKGNNGVSREGACLLALNTLKATEVEYDGNNVSVVGEGINVNVGNNSYKYVTSNNKNINQNINKNKDNQSSEYTLEFGEEHFTDLKLTATGSANDDFGRPSNEWSYKNSKIGTYAATADKTYTKGADGDTDADMVKDMGIKDFKVSKSYYTENGVQKSFGVSTDVAKLAKIANLTAKGVLVELFMDEDNADTIKDVVVIKTQMMRVNTVRSNEVTLKTANTDTNANITNTVNTVKDDDDAYSTLKGLKADDYVLIVPVKDGNNWRVFSAAVPQAVTGKMTNIKVNSKNTQVKAVTVAGTAYDMSALWNSADNELNVNTRISSTTDTTVYLDSYGYAIYVTDVTSSNNAIIIDEIFSSLSDGKIVKSAKGWDTNGNELTINLGRSINYSALGFAQNDDAALEGKVFEYKTSNNDSADYELVKNSTTVNYTVPSSKNVHVYKVNSFVKAGASKATVNGGDVYFDSDVKFIFMSMDENDVTGITVKNGVSEVGKAGTTYDLSYVLNKDGDRIIAVVIPNDDDAAVTANLLYLQKVTNHINNADGKRVALFTAYINGEEMKDLQLNKDASTNDTDKFYTYSKNESTGVYTLSSYSKVNKATAVKTEDGLTKDDMISDTYFKSATSVNDGSVGAVLNAKNATVVDLYTDDGVTYSSLKEMRDAMLAGTVSGFTVSYIYNGADTAGSGTVSYLFITANTSVSGSGSSTGVAAPAGTVTPASVTYYDKTTAIVNLSAERASFVPAAASMTVTYDLYVNGVKTTGKTATIGANETLGRAIVDGLQILPTDTLTVKVTSVKADMVNVNYVDENGYAITVYSDAACTKAAKTMISTTGDAAALTFYVKTSDTTTALTATVLNDTEVGGVKTANVVAGKATYTAANKVFVVDTTANTPAGQSVVTIKVSGLKNLTSAYSVAVATDINGKALSALGYTTTAADKATAEALTFTLASNKTSVPSNNNAVVLTGTLSAALGVSSTHGIQVVVTDGSKEYALNFLNNTTATATVAANIIKDTTFSIVSIKDLTAPVVTSISAEDKDGSRAFSIGDVITVNFSESVSTEDANVTFDGALAADKTWNNDKTVLTLTITTAPTATTDGIKFAKDTIASTVGVIGYTADKTITVTSAAEGFTNTLTLA